MKRGKPRARGRYMRVRRRTCHLTILLLPIELAEVEEAPPVEEAPKPRRSRAKKAEAAAPAEAPAEERRRGGGRRGAAGCGRARGEPRRGAGACRGEEAEPRPPRTTASPRPLPRRTPTRRPPTTRKGKPDGTEGPSRWAARRDHPRVEVQLVHEKGVLEVPARGHPHPPAHLRTALARGPLGHPHPQGLAEDHDRHLHGPAGDRDRQVGHRGRRAAPLGLRAHRARRADQHQRDQAAGARREADGAVRRRAAPEPRLVPACDEALARERRALGRPGRPRQVRWPPRRHRDVAHRAVLGGSRAAAHAARRHRLRLRRGAHDLRPDRRQGLDQQGRDHARGLRAHRGADAPRRGRRPSPQGRRARRDRGARPRAARPAAARPRRRSRRRRRRRVAAATARAAVAAAVVPAAPVGPAVPPPRTSAPRRPAGARAGPSARSRAPAAAERPRDGQAPEQRGTPPEPPQTDAPKPPESGNGGES